MTLPSGLQLTVADDIADEHLRRLAYGLEDFNEEQWPGHEPWIRLAILVRDGTRLCAGLEGHTYMGWLFVQHLWVTPPQRGQGIGRLLMAEAERTARERGAHSAWLDTYSFQAPGFYEKLGYRQFGELDYPPGRKRCFLQKRLG
jgi:GNAT superfamily N-acetyltransferase